MVKQAALITLLGSLCCSQQSAAQNKLRISVAGVKGNGTVYIAIYNKPDCFGKPDKAFRKVVIKPTAEAMADVTENLPTGNYAIAVYQDLNNNRKIDKNLLGIPTEPFGFSNNVRPVVSAPTFKQCLVTLDKPEVAINIGLRTYL